MKINQYIDFSRAIVGTTFTLPNTETKNCTNCSVDFFLMKNGDNKQCSESKVLILGGKEPVKSTNLSRNLLAVSQLELKLHHVINVLKREKLNI